MKTVLWLSNLSFEQNEVSSLSIISHEICISHFLVIQLYSLAIRRYNFTAGEPRPNVRNSETTEFNVLLPVHLA
jgi:hypothetical protein